VCGLSAHSATHSRNGRNLLQNVRAYNSVLLTQLHVVLAELTAGANLQVRVYQTAGWALSVPTSCQVGREIEIRPAVFLSTSMHILRYPCVYIQGVSRL
jgi:hypothetical protein